MSYTAADTRARARAATEQQWRHGSAVVNNADSSGPSSWAARCLKTLCFLASLCFLGLLADYQFCLCLIGDGGQHCYDDRRVVAAKHMGGGAPMPELLNSKAEREASVNKLFDEILDSVSRDGSSIASVSLANGTRLGLEVGDGLRAFRTCLASGSSEEMPCSRHLRETLQSADDTLDMATTAIKTASEAIEQKHDEVDLAQRQLERAQLWRRTGCWTLLAEGVAGAGLAAMSTSTMIPASAKAAAAALASAALPAPSFKFGAASGVTGAAVGYCGFSEEQIKQLQMSSAQASEEILELTEEKRQATEVKEQAQQFLADMQRLMELLNLNPEKTGHDTA